jgi:ATP-binding cassette subfamily B protein/ATP-binding cassette subfamily C protein/ATP-binding cassette subfamily B multidrug efflux pump
VVAAARVNALLDEPLAPAATGAAVVQDGRLSVRDLNFSYTTGRQVLHGLNLEVAPGAFVGIVGHTGSGKSTLLSLLLRFYPAPAGTLAIDGQAIATLADDDFRRRVGLVPQEPFLLAASARENIAMGRTLSDAEVEAAAHAARAHDFIVRLAQGYDTPLGEGGARLAVG